MRIVHATFGLCLLLAATGCSTVKVRTAYDTGTDLARLKTYAWYPRPAPAADELAEQAARRCALDQKILQALHEELSGMGFRAVSENPDFLVNFHVTVDDRIDVEDWGYSYAARKRYRNPKGFGVVEVAEYEKGTLIVDFVDPTTHQLVWRGEAQAGLAPDRTEQQGERVCGKAVKEILKHFPPPSAPPGS